MKPESSRAGLAVEFAGLHWDGRDVRVEYEWVPGDDSAPLIVFLHEGLGSRSMWRGFPQALCTGAGCRGLVYSRPGYGQSSAPTEKRRGVDYLHRQAREVLPALLDALHVQEPVWLFGHSDGGSIALLFAAAYPSRVTGVVAVAPHIYVEDVTLRGVRAARDIFRSSGLGGRLGRYHADPAGVFRNWADIWLAPEFRGWNIEEEIEAITCPVLAVQGTDDEYATLAQVHDIARLVPGARAVELAGSGHSPHRDQPEALIAAATQFMAAR